MRAIVLTISDKGSQGLREDTAGPAVCKLLEGAGYSVVETKILPDEREDIKNELLHIAEGSRAELVITVGGTGFAPRDVTPEATLDVVEKLCPGIPEAMRLASAQKTKRAMLSRAQAGIRKRTLIINVPGSEKAARENLEAVLPGIGHGLDMLLERRNDCASQPDIQAL
jgi:molybdenum cofactor synthesis domain-containing protein